MKVGIVIITFNIDNRIFLMQQEAIKKYCKDPEYTVEIFDNSSSEQMSEDIKHHSKACGINYHRTISSVPDPSVSHSFAANFAYKTLRDIYDAFFFMDHDLIPVKPFYLEEIIGAKIMAGVTQGSRVKYLWPGCLLFNNNEIDKDLINFNPNNAYNIDTGGELRNVIDKYGTDAIRYLDEVGCQNPVFFATPLYYFYMMIHEFTFLHMRNGSQWDPVFEEEKRINSLINIATEKMKATDDLLLQQ